MAAKLRNGAKNVGATLFFCTETAGILIKCVLTSHEDRQLQIFKTPLTENELCVSELTKIEF